MYRKNGFVSKGLVVKSGLVLLAAVCVLSLFGCGRRLARLERNQQNLQKIMEKNTVEFARNSAAIRQNQREIKSSIRTAGFSNASASSRIAAIEKGQTKLQELLTNSNREIVENINLSRDHISNNANSNSREIVGNITSSRDRIISKAQANRDEIINNTAASSNKTIQSVVAVGESRHKQLAEAQKDARAVTAEVAGLSSSLGKLEVKLPENLSRDLNDIKENQHKLHNGIETLQADFNELSSEVVVVKENQNKLRSNLETENKKVRTDIMKALERLNTLISEISSSDEIDEGTAVAARKD